MARNSNSATCWQLFALGGIFISGLAGCSDVPGDMPPDESPQMQTQATYYSDIQPLMERYCVSCHKTGEIAPFTLGDYEAVKGHARQITAAVQNDLMPPWLPSDDSLPLHYSRKLRPEDKKLLLDWLAAGAPEGDAKRLPRTDIPPAERATPPRNDLTIQLGAPYRPNAAGGGDDYRCFAFDPKLDRDRFLTAGQVNPDNGSIVHHVVLYVIPPAQAAQAMALDKGSGYTCFGGAGISGAMASIVLAWAPGGTSMRTPDATAFKLPKGAAFVLQMHYNMLSDNGKPDQTGVVLELSDNAPSRELLNMFIANPKLMIKAGDANAHQEVSVPLSYIAPRLGLPSGDLTVYGAFPHMHLLGKHINVSVLGGPNALDIPRWDFHWQATYMFKEPFTIKPADILHLECDWDNSAANQPMVNGMPQTPRDVSWGEGTLDEMCVSLLLISSAK